MRTLLLTAALLLPACSSPWAPTPNYFASVGKLSRVAGGYGTGTVVAHTADGFLVLTCHHVLRGDAAFNFTAPAGSWGMGTVHAFDRQADWALIRFVSPDRPRILPVAAGPQKPFSSGWAAGYPMGVKRMHVTRVLFQGERRIDGLGAPGSSGGPVFNGRGEIVALYRAIWRPSLDNWSGGGRANMGWIAHLSDLKDLPL